MKLQVLIVCVFVSQAFAANILFFFSMGSKSHKLVHWPLAKALAARGHNVTIQSPFNKVEDVANITEIHPKKSTDYTRHFVESAVMTRPMWSIESYILLPVMTFVYADTCPLSLDAQESVLWQKPTFDLVFIDDLTSDCGLALAYVHNASAAFVTTPGYFPTVSMRSGNPYHLSVLPLTGFPYLSLSSIWGRVVNALTNTMIYVWRYYYMLPKLDAIVRKEVSPHIPPLAELEKEVSLTLINQHFTTGHPRPQLPNVVEVGGMHCVPSKPLPEDLKTFLDGSSDAGFIYMSFGTLLQPSHYPKEVLEALVKTFAQIPQRVVWKWSGDAIPGLSSNVMTRKWIPQQDILGHTKIRLLITHGGVLSQQEAVCKGVPILTVPFLFDQFVNAHNAENLGYGKVLYLDDIRTDVLHETVVKMTTDRSFLDAAKRVSKLYHDTPMSAVERAVFWTEYVLRHKGADHMKSPARNAPLYQYYLVDVAVVLLVISSLGIAISFWIGRALWRRIASYITFSNSSDKKFK